MADFRVLFIRLRSLGDTVLMTPALEIASRRGKASVGVVCERPFHEVLEENPFVSEIFVSRRNATVFERLGLIRKLRKFKADFVIDLHGGPTAAFLTALSGAPGKVGYGYNRNSWLYNHKVPPSSEIWGKREIHTVEHQLSPLMHLGYEVRQIPPLRMPIREADLRIVRKMLEDQDVPPGYILIHPAAAFATKTWPVSRFSELARRFRSDGHSVVATAGPGEEALLKSLESDAGGAVTVVPPVSIQRFGALASLSRLFVGNDTGTTHIASALQIPVVAVFGSSNWRVWNPWGTSYELIRSNLACIPCPGYSCLEYDEPRCIQSIEVEPVYRAACRLLNEAESPGGVPGRSQDE